MKRTLLRALSLIFFLIFLLLLLATIFAVYNGTAEKIILFFRVLTNPTLAMNNSIGIAALLGNVFAQFFIIWIFYYLAAKLWKAGRLNISSDN